MMNVCMYVIKSYAAILFDIYFACNKNDINLYRAVEIIIHPKFKELSKYLSFCKFSFDCL